MGNMDNNNISEAKAPEVLEDIKNTVKEYFGVLQQIQKVNAEVVDNLKEYKVVINENRQLRNENKCLRKELLELKEQMNKEQDEMERD